MKKFQYRELPSEAYTRIMELLPGTQDDAIQCNLTSELRQDIANTYDAISYTWGSLVDPVEVICGNESLSITTNLEDALREIRSQNPKKSRRLWVDAICINQSNSEEKNHQVKHLGQVYENARQVFAWLGSDEDGIANDCFHILKEWNVYLDEQLDIYKNPRNIPYLEPPHHLCLDAEEGSKIGRLMNRSWFSRVWVLQEAGLAKDCQLLWGNSSMSLAELIEFACFCDGRTDITQLIGGDESIFRYWRVVFTCVYRTYDNTESWRVSKPLIRSLNERHRDQPGLFLDILQTGKSLSATDSRDYIYAFLGNPLAYSPNGKLLLEPDYKKHESEVYYDAALAFLNSRHESPFFLSFVQHSSADDVTRSKEPSWIPRWKKTYTNPTSGFTIGNIGLSFKAGGAPERLKYQVERGVCAERLLGLQGFTFDHLTWISKPLRSENFALNRTQWDEELRTSQQTYIDMLWNDLPLGFKERSCLSKTPEGVRFDENFTYTLVTGYNNRRVVRFNDHRKMFRAYLEALESANRPEDCNGAAPSSERKACDASRYERETRNCTGRRMALTKLGRFALVPQFARPGDVCCVFLGMVTPFIVRQVVMENDEKTKCHHLVGEAYVQGVMQGELVAGLDRGDLEKEDIILM